MFGLPIFRRSRPLNRLFFFTTMPNENSHHVKTVRRNDERTPHLSDARAQPKPPVTHAEKTTGRTLWRRHTQRLTSTSSTNSVSPSSSAVEELRVLWPWRAARESCSTPLTTSRQLRTPTPSDARPKRPVNSGYVRSFLCRAARSTAPSSSAARVCGVPSLRSGETMVASSANCAPTALSTANPLRPRTPEFAHAARWWPLESSGRPHRQMARNGVGL